MSHRQELQIKLLDLSKDKKLPYVEQKRRYGEGPIRINKKIDLSEDIAGLTFVCMMNDTHLAMYVDFETGDIIPEEERASIGGVLLKATDLKDFADSQPGADDRFITNLGGERVIYNGKHVKLKDMLRKAEYLTKMRAKFYQLNLLCCITQTLILY
jgi:hypothetical protein